MNEMMHCQICHGNGPHLCGGTPTACPPGGHVSQETSQQLSRLSQRVSNLEEEMEQLRYQMGVANRKLDPDDHSYE